MNGFKQARLAFFAMTLLLPAAAANAGHCHHCRKVIVCCNCCGQGSKRSAEFDEEDDRRSRAAQPVSAPIVNSTAVFTVPMMYATMPVMPAMMQQQTSRGASQSGGVDCCDRVDKLEQEMIKLQRNMGELQTLMQSQTDVLKILAEDLKTRRAPLSP